MAITWQPVEDLKDLREGDIVEVRRGSSSLLYLVLKDSPSRNEHLTHFAENRKAQTQLFECPKGIFEVLKMVVVRDTADGIF